MNFKKYNPFIYLLIFMSFYGCEDFFSSTVEIDMPDHEKRISVGAIFANDVDYQRLYVNHTVGSLDPIGEIDENVTEVILIHENSDEEDEYVFEYYGLNPYNHNYQNNTIPPFTVGDSYTLSIKSEGLESVKSTVIYQEPVPLDSIFFDANGGINLEGEDLVAFDLYFQDPPNEKNYYRVEAVSGLYINRDFFYFTDLEPETIESAIYHSILISDATFDGEYKHLRLTANNYNYNEDKEVNFKWITISEEQYHYEQRINQLSNIQDNPFASPYSVGGNIENGEGIFAIESRLLYTLD